MENYKVLLFHSRESVVNELKFLHRLGIVEFDQGNNIIKLNIDTITKLGTFTEKTYIYEIDALYRETIERIKNAALEYFCKHYSQRV